MPPTRASRGEDNTVPVHLWFVTLLFAAVLLLASLHLLSAIGQFPKEERAPVISTSLGTLTLYLSIIHILIAVAASIWLAAGSLPWYVAVLAGGTAVLIAPLVLQRFSDGFVDGFGSLTFFPAGALAAAAALWFIR